MVTTPHKQATTHVTAVKIEPRGEDPTWDT